jgi:hypothetical protein
MIRARRAALLALAAVASGIFTGCTSVEPWERGHLAKPHMALEPNPELRALRNHVYTSREAALADQAGRGGGCGCY